MSLLELRGVSKTYPETGFLGRETGHTTAIEGVSLSLERGEVLGVVGESGAGKSTLARIAAGLDSATDGRVRFDGAPMADADRGRVGFVFQRPAGSFDPRVEVVDSVAEPLRIAGVGREPARERAEESLARVGVDATGAYPHELSGGQQQRAALARALVRDPDLLVLDEPTSALDPGTQASVLALVEELRAAFDLAVLFVAHDLRVVRATCERVAVLYAGELVARGPVPGTLDDPAHPYARALVDATSLPDPGADPGVEIAGNPADAADPPEGCRFHPRCPEVVLPDGFAGGSAAFRTVLRFRRRLSDGDVRPAPPRTLRDRFGLPTLDGGPERCLRAALDRAAEGETDAAAALLSRVFTTPCERTNPDLRSSGDQMSACLRTED